MADWKSPEHLASHFRAHRRLLRIATVEEYDASAQEIIEIGTSFEYRDPRTRDWRVGYYDRPTERFTAVNDDGELVTHLRCRERYVRGLPNSTYA